MPSDSRAVESVEIIPAQVDYRIGYRWAFTEYKGPIVLLVKMRDAAGTEAWGELPISFHPTIPGDALGSMVRGLAERLVIGKVPNPRTFTAEAATLTGWLWYPHLGATIISGIELALWDLMGKQHGLHVTELLGGRVRDSMECMWFVFDDEPAAMAEATVAGAQRGFRAYYVKWHGEDADMFAKLAAVRDSLPGNGKLRIDPNEAWTRASALPRLQALDGWPIEFVEQPLPRLDRRGAADLRLRQRIAICSDQGTRVLEEVLESLAAGAMDLLTVCPSDAGGMLRALEICATARSAGLPVGMHSNNELGVGLAAMVSVACLAENCTYAAQTEYQHLDWEVTTGLVWDGPRLRLDYGKPGWGIEVDPVLLERAHANYIAGHANRFPIDVTPDERQFVPGY